MKLKPLIKTPHCSYLSLIAIQGQAEGEVAGREGTISRDTARPALVCNHPAPHAGPRQTQYPDHLQRPGPQIPPAAQHRRSIQHPDPYPAALPHALPIKVPGSPDPAVRADAGSHSAGQREVRGGGKEAGPAHAVPADAGPAHAVPADAGAPVHGLLPPQGPEGTRPGEAGQAVRPPSRAQHLQQVQTTEDCPGPSTTLWELVLPCHFRGDGERVGGADEINGLLIQEEETTPGPSVKNY